MKCTRTRGSWGQGVVPDFKGLSDHELEVWTQTTQPKDDSDDGKPDGRWANNGQVGEQLEDTRS